jgi:hypothetical protein
MRTAKITVEVEVDNVPDHITDTQVLDALRSQVGWDIRWPEPRSHVRNARLVEAPTAETVAPVTTDADAHLSA